jgi:two-component system sensor histidine kinase DesK
VVAFILFECFAVLAEGAFFTVVTPDGPFHIGWPNTFIAIFLVVVIGGGNIYFAEQRRAECKLREALEENVTLAAVAERERIARDLHDVLGHTLSVIVLKAELAGRLVSLDPARATAEMADVERTSRAALAEIREAIGGYRSRGLGAEIDAARRTLDAAGVTLLTESKPDRESFSPQEETALALALREAVTNIVRHAHATTCRFRFVSETGHRKLVVEDDGQHPVVREGNGLRGMRERIESLGGHFSLECGIAQNHGTRLTIELPHREAARS